MVTNILEEWISFVDMTFSCTGDNLYKTLQCHNQEGCNLYVCSHENLKSVYILCGFFFWKETLMYLAFFIFHTWCWIHCPILHLFFLLHTVAIVLSWQFVPEQWDMTLCIIFFSLVAVMWYHNTLFCCPVFPSVSQSWGITVLNCGRGTILSSSSSRYSFFCGQQQLNMW